MVGVFERLRAAVEGRVIELPLRRGELPDQLREVVPVFLITLLAALGREIELVPPLQLGRRWQRQLAGLLTREQIAADRDHGFASPGKSSCDDIRGPRTPADAIFQKSN